MIRGRQSSNRETFLGLVALTRAVKVSIIVGTLLLVLNHGDQMLVGNWPVWWKIVLTYLVPLCVSSYSSVALVREVRMDSRLRTKTGAGA